MNNKNKKKDTFLESVGNVKPIKKSNRNYKKVKNLVKKNVNKMNFSIPIIDEENTPNKNILKVEPPLINNKLKKSKIQINKKIDFHGLSIDAAKKLFLQTINDCFYSNKRFILFVTGKGIKKTIDSSNNNKLFHGKIRENFKTWIFEKEVESKILNFSSASSKYGGDGAFFVYLRKNKN